MLFFRIVENHYFFNTQPELSWASCVYRNSCLNQKFKNPQYKKSEKSKATKGQKNLKS